MAKLLPFRSPERAQRERTPRLVNLDEESADEVFAALSSDTTRAILNELYEEPATASDVAEAVDTSLQNARYHLDKLESAGLIEAVDTWYSSRGTEMTVYAPTNEPLVVAAGREEKTSVLRDALKRVVGAVALLGLASLLVERVVRRLSPTAAFHSRGTGGDVAVSSGAERTETVEPGGGGGDGGDGAGGDDAADGDSAEIHLEEEAETATPTPEATEAAEEADAAATPTPEADGTPAPEPAADTTTPTEAPSATAADTATPAETPTEAIEATRDSEVAELATTPVTPESAGPLEALGSLPPGALFFAGGLLVILLAAGWWYWTSYRPMYG